MLTEIDRVLVMVPDARSSANKWCALVGAKIKKIDSVPELSAKRITLCAGSSEIELLEPNDEGPTSIELRRRGRSHLFAAGATTNDPTRVAEHAKSHGAKVTTLDDRYLIEIEIEGSPIRFVVSHESVRTQIGSLDFLYEATVLASNQAHAVARISETFALDPRHFTTITSDEFGYSGVLTLFREGSLHRFEVITPTDHTKTMGRYYAREGASYYMAFAESSSMTLVEENARSLNAGITVDRPKDRPISLTADQLWLHPQALGGIMLGISRPTMAWNWSGHPERVNHLE
jgi:hypothetical protein